MIGSILQVFLLLAEWWLKKQANNAEALAAFYKFAHSINKNHLGSEKAAQKWKDQAAALEAELSKVVHPIEG